MPARWGTRVETGHDPTPPRVWRQAEFNALIARIEPPVRRRATRPTEPAGDYNPDSERTARRLCHGAGGNLPETARPGHRPAAATTRIRVDFPRWGGYPPPGGTYQPPSGGLAERRAECRLPFARDAPEIE